MMAAGWNIFISHKHVADEKIASVLASHIRRWAKKHALQVRVVQSSDPAARGVRLGDPLKEGLANLLWSTRLLLLVYTSEDQDWSWCMWECGVATKPGSPKARIVVFRCTDDEPKLFPEQVDVDARNPSDLESFARELVSGSLFRRIARSEELNAAQVAQAKAVGDQLHAELAAVIRARRLAEVHGQPYLRLRLNSDDDTCVAQWASSAGIFETAAQVSDISPRALGIFGRETVDANTTLKALLSPLRGLDDNGPAWLDDMRMQVLAAANGEIVRPMGTVVRQVGGTNRFTPVLTLRRNLAAVAATEFDICFLPVASGSELERACTPLLHAACDRFVVQAGPLAPYLVDLAKQRLEDWGEHLGQLVTPAGAATSGHERLLVTRALVEATKQYLIVERFINVPEKMHSKDWMKHYTQTGADPSVSKTWVLFADDAYIQERRTELDAMAQFFRDRNFETLVCRPSDLRNAIGKDLPERTVYECYGDFVKVLTLAADSYIAGRDPNVITTSIHKRTAEEQAMLARILEFATPLE